MKGICGCSSSGRAPPCQGGGSEFEPRQPLQKTKHRLSVDAFCFIRRIIFFYAEAHFSMRKHKLTFSPVPASSMQKARICPIESVFWPPSAARGCRCPPTGAKGDRTPSMVSCPLLTPLTFLCADTSEMCSETGDYGGSVPCVGSLLGRCYALNSLCVIRRA